MRKPNQFSLLAQRRFAPFFWVQFCGALNDNVFKTALLTILTFEALSWTTLDRTFLNNLIPGLFILPFVLFSAIAGQLADKFEKSALVRYIKLFEIAIMLLAAIGWMRHDLWLLIAAVAGMGFHSALFGPVKYAYLPQKLAPEELIGGNGLVEMGTFVGILLGEVLGAVLVLHKPWGIELVTGGTIAIALLGWLASRAVPHSPAPVPTLKINWNIVSETVHNIRYSRQNRPVFLSMLANSWFWFYGAILLAQFPMYAKEYLHGDHSIFVLLLTIFSLGIGAGSLVCERLSGHKVEIGLTPLGAIGLSVFGFDLALASIAYTHTELVGIATFLPQTGSLRILFDCLMIGVFGGLYIVPLFALIQTRCDPTHMSRTIAGMNILNALFMVMAALTAMILLGAGLSIPQLFMVVAVLNAVVASYIFTAFPEFLVRFSAWILIHTTHRIQSRYAERIPQRGGALLVCNRIGGFDALALMTTTARPIRFVLNCRTLPSPLLPPLFKMAKTIPVIGNGMASQIESSYEAIASAVAQGEVVCIFADELLAVFKDDAEKIFACGQTPILPIVLRNMNPASQKTIYRISRLELVVGDALSQEQRTLEAVYARSQDFQHVCQC